jgi:hypothetical protein
LLNGTAHKGGKLGLLPTFVVAQLDMDKVQTVEGVLDFNSSKHVDTAILAGVTLNNCFLVDDVQFAGAGGNGEGRAGYDGYDAEDCARGFPAFGAAASVVVGDIRG